jgi:hypothetical protein
VVLPKYFTKHWTRARSIGIKVSPNKTYRRVRVFSLPAIYFSFTAYRCFNTR